MEKAKRKKLGRRILGVALAVALAGLLQAIPGTVRTAYAADDITVTIDTKAQVTLRDADGDGYYEISNADELYAFAAAVNGGNTGINGELTADIVVNESLEGNQNLRAWTPIGSSDMPYKGKFDGVGHTVKGLYYDDTSAKYVGLFGNLSGSYLKNVGVIDSYISGMKYVGGVCGDNFNGTVEGCYNTGSVSGAESVGGVCGYNYSGTVEGCYNTGSVTGTDKYIGGVCGDNTKGTVTDCYNTGSVSGDTRIGGVCGYNYNGTVTDSYNTGSVSGTYRIGGVCGNNEYSGTVTDSYNTGSVSGTGLTGGVCGYHYSGGTENNCYSLEDNDESKAKFRSGEICWLLNNSTASGDSAWGQNIGTDMRPVLGGPVVYQYTQNSSTFYTNTEIPTYNDGVYEIDSAEELLWFAEYVNGGEKNANAVLMNDIDMTNVKWTTICETGLYYTAYGSDDGYSGTFDGNGHVISNLKVTSSADAATSAGLFGTVSGTIKNLGIENFTLVDSGKDMRAGAIVGQLIKTGKVSNCYVKVADIQTGDNVAGGIAGCVYEGTVENCYAVNVTVNGASGRFGYVTGDVCADGNSADGTDRPGTVKNCYTDGSTLTSTQKGANSVVGGEAGVSADRFASGEVAYLLNGSKSTGTLAWYQTLTGNSVDACPVLDSEHGTVYQVNKYDCPDDTEAEVSYSNTDGDIRGTEHVDANGDGHCDICNSEWIPAVDSNDDGVYEIGNAYQLYWFAEFVKSGNKAANAELTADIDFSEWNFSTNPWTPICQTKSFHESVADDTGYSGTFDGKGYTISNLIVTGKTGDIYSYGLFGTVSGTVKNLGMVNYKFTIGSASDARAGSVAGQVLTEGTITNCYSVGHNVDTNDSKIAGGIAGCNYGGTISNCYALNGTVTGHEDRWGGVVGDSKKDSTAPDLAQTYGIVSNCYTDDTRVVSSQNDSGSITNCAVKDDDAFASGEVAYLLNDSSSEDVTWYQTLETDTYPVLDRKHGTVYYGYDKCKAVYANGEVGLSAEPGGHTWVSGECSHCGLVCSHELVNDTCSICGYVREKEITIVCTEGTFDKGEYTFDVATKVHTINTNKAVTISGTTTTETVVIAKDVSANITLSGVSIDVSKKDNACAFKIEDDSTGNVTVTLADGSSNTLLSGWHCAGLQKNGTVGTLTLCGGEAGTGSLTAQGGSSGAGIGGGYEGAGSTITINGGTVTATGDWYAAGIGGGYKGAGSTITINGGTVTATSGSMAAGIGGGANGTGSNINISGGTVTAISNYTGAGIGGGEGGEGTGITISGGTVTATSAENGAGIGGGSRGTGSNITISGGTVTATSAEGGAGIGGGANGTGSNITISGGSVEAIAEDYDANAIGGGYNRPATTPTADGTTPVYLLEIANENGANIVINGKDYPDAHGAEKKIYAYLPAGTDADPNVVSFNGEGTLYCYNAKNGSWIKTCGSENHVDANGDCICDNNNCDVIFAATVTTADGSSKMSYISLEEAISAAEENEGSTVTLAANITMGTYVAIDRGTVTIDLNGYRWESSSWALYVEGTANVSITGGTIEGEDEDIYWKGGTIVLSEHSSPDGIKVSRDGDATTTIADIVLPEGYVLADGNLCVVDDFSGVNRTITYTVKKDNRNNVTFDANGGTCSMPSDVTTLEGKLTSLPGATHESMYFKGWYDASEGGNKITLDHVFTVDTTIYAQYRDECPHDASDIENGKCICGKGYIYVELADDLGDGWDGNTIELWKNGERIETITMEDGRTASYLLEYDSSANYLFQWGEGAYSYECSFTIYAAGDKKLEGTGEDCSSYDDGQTILILGFVITEQPTVMNPTVGTNDTEATYQWYEASGIVVDVTMENIYEDGDDWEAVNEDGWFTCEYSGDYESYFFALELKAGDVVTVSAQESIPDYDEDLLIRKYYDYYDYYDRHFFESVNGSEYEFSIEVPEDGIWYIGTWKNICIKATMGRFTADMTKPVEGEDEATLQNPVRGKSYVCVVTFRNGTTETSKAVSYEEATFLGTNITLTDSIDMNFHVKIPEDIAPANVKVKFTVNGEEKTPVDLTGPANNGAYRATYHVAAKEMTDEITAELMVGETVVASYTTSVRKYAETILADTENATYTAKTQALVKTMLNYGAYAQTYFDYNTTNLANAGHEDNALAVTKGMLVGYVPTVTDNNDALDYAGSTLILESNIKVRHYFKLTDETALGNVSGLTLYVAPQANPVDGTYYYYESAGITVANLGAMTDYEGVEGISISYCPLSYVTTVVAEKKAELVNEFSDLENDTALQNLMKALYLYYQAVKYYNAV